MPFHETIYETRSGKKTPHRAAQEQNRGKGEALRVARNHSGAPIGRVEMGEGHAVIVGEVAGIAEVDARYGIVAEAINDETDDTLRWIKAQHDVAARRIFGGFAL